MHFIFEQIRSGGDRNFGYVLADRDAGLGVLIDPSYSPETFVERAREQRVAVTHIINTHSHPDHTNGNDEALRLTGAPLAAHLSASTAPAVRLADGDSIDVGSLHLVFLHVPGHCPDHLVVYEAAHGILITGDLLFVGKVGGTQTDEDAATEWNSLQRLLALPPETTVWPGHDYGVRPSSTLGLERRSNPFLQCADLPSFLRLKHEWSEVKRRHGLK